MSKEARKALEDWYGCAFDDEAPWEIVYSHDDPTGPKVCIAVVRHKKDRTVQIARTFMVGKLPAISIDVADLEAA